MGDIISNAPFAHIRIYRAPKMQPEGWPKRSWIDPEGGLDRLAFSAKQVLGDSCAIEHVEATSEQGHHAGYDPSLLLIVIEVFGASFPGSGDDLVRHKVGSAVVQIANFAMRLLAYRETNMGGGERDSAPWTVEIVPSVRVGLVVHGRGISVSTTMKRADQVVDRLVVRPQYPMVAR